MRRPSMIAAILVGLAVLTTASPASAMYHPTVGRWMARDPIGYADSMNLYECVGSSPVLWVDPLGLAPYPPWMQRDVMKGINDSARFRTEQQRTHAISTARALAPEGAIYSDKFGLRTLADRLAQAAQNVPDYKGLGPWDKLIAKGVFDPLSNTMSFDPDVSEEVLIHELGHAYDFQNHIYLTRLFGSNKEAAEAMGYTLMNMVGVFNILSQLESSMDQETCARLKQRWDGAWAEAANMPMRHMQWGLRLNKKTWIPEQNDRNLRPEDIKDTMAKFGFNVSCSKLVGRYNALMAEKGIRDDQKTDGCCSFKCPDFLRGTPFE